MAKFVQVGGQDALMVDQLSETGLYSNYWAGSGETLPLMQAT
jgi:hypothetical protein